MGVDFGGGVLTGNALDIFLAKYSPAGTYLSSQLFGGDGTDQGNAVAIDGSGRVVVTGSTHSTTIDFGSGPLASRGGYDVFLFHRAP